VGVPVWGHCGHFRTSSLLLPASDGDGVPSAPHCRCWKESETQVEGARGNAFEQGEQTPACGSRTLAHPVVHYCPRLLSRYREQQRGGVVTEAWGPAEPGIFGLWLFIEVLLTRLPAAVLQTALSLARTRHTQGPSGGLSCPIDTAGQRPCPCPDSPPQILPFLGT